MWKRIQFWCGSNKRSLICLKMWVLVHLQVNSGVGLFGFFWMQIESDQKEKWHFCVIVPSKWAGDSWRCPGNLVSLQVCSVEMNQINEGPKYLRFPSRMKFSRICWCENVKSFFSYWGNEYISELRFWDFWLVACFAADFGERNCVVIIVNNITFC